MMPILKMSERNRVYFLDFAKIIACFLVIYGHITPSDSAACRFLYSFHLPVFFLVGGVFHKYLGYVQWKKNATALLVPFLFFLILDTCFKYVDSWIHTDGFQVFPEALTSCKYVILCLLRSTGLGPYWFLPALFWCRIMFDFHLRYSHLLFALFWLVAFLFPVFSGVRIPLFFSQGVMGLPFYFTGFILSKQIRSLSPHWKYLFVFFISLAFTVLLSRWNGKVSMNGYMFGSNLPVYLGIPVFYLNGFTGSAMVLALSLLPLPELKSVKLLSSSLLAILGVQGIFIILFSHFLNLHSQPGFLGILIPVLATVCILWLCYFFHRLFHRLYLLRK